MNIFTWIPFLRESDNKNDWGYHRLPGIKKPENGDIVIFNSPEEIQALMVKRVSYIFKKGDTIYVNADNIDLVKGMAQYEENDIVLVNGKVYINSKLDSSYIFLQNHYYLRGDNESVSRDSRYWGCIPESAIAGKVNRVLFSSGDSTFSISRLFHKIQ